MKISASEQVQEWLAGFFHTEFFTPSSFRTPTEQWVELALQASQLRYFFDDTRASRAISSEKH